MNGNNSNQIGKICDPELRLYQLRLNSIREKYHYNWKSLDPDGIWGPITASAVEAFQKQYGIPSNVGLNQATKKKIVSIDSEYLCLKDTSIAKGNRNYSTHPIVEVYNSSVKTIGYFNTANSITNTKEKGLATIFSEWEKMIDHQQSGLLRRLNKFPVKESTRIRNVVKQLDGCKKFIGAAKLYGINVDSIAKLGLKPTKDQAIKYIKDICDLIKNSPITKGVKFINWSFAKIKTIIDPFIKLLNKVPGLKYASAIDKLLQGTLEMILGNFEKSFTYYCDGLRILIEQIVIDAAVAAAIALGGWVALVIVIVLIIASFLIDYLFFSDNPGDSLADKYLHVNTTNLVQDYAPNVYRKINN